MSDETEFTGEEIAFEIGVYSHVFKKTKTGTLVYSGTRFIKVVEDDDDDDVKPFNPSEYR